MGGMSDMELAKRMQDDDLGADAETLIKDLRCVDHAGHAGRVLSLCPITAVAAPLAKGWLLLGTRRCTTCVQTRQPLDFSSHKRDAQHSVFALTPLCPVCAGPAWVRSTPTCRTSAHSGQQWSPLPTWQQPCSPLLLAPSPACPLISWPRQPPCCCAWLESQVCCMC